MSIYYCLAPSDLFPFIGSKLIPLFEKGERGDFPMQ